VCDDPAHVLTHAVTLKSHAIKCPGSDGLRDYWMTRGDASFNKWSHMRPTIWGFRSN